MIMTESNCFYFFRIASVAKRNAVAKSRRKKRNVSNAKRYTNTLIR